MPPDQETALALAAAVQRVTSWSGAGIPPPAAAVVSIAQQLELAARAEVVRGVRRLREAGETWLTVDDCSAESTALPPRKPLTLTVTCMNR
ncbi:MAG: hypothetical protein ACR2FU_12740 [Streptosporangiaceae bacterium]